MGGEANKQITQMISFILAEAKDKANDIDKKGEEEFSIEVHRLITEQKEKTRGSFEKKTKQIETQYAIAKSMAINKMRLEKIKARQEVMIKLADEVRAKLTGASSDKAFVTKLITQGLLMLLEEDVVVRCRAADKSMVQGCLAAAAAEYTKLIKDQTGADKKCKLVIDETNAVDASSLGGVILSNQDGKITIDNTLDLRLKLVMEQDKPAIRKLLFP